MNNQQSNHKIFFQRTAKILSTTEQNIPRILTNAPFKSCRINRIKSQRTTQEIVDYFSNINIVLRPLRWYSDAFIFDAEDTAKIQESELTQNGEIFIQNPSSYLPVFALEPTAHESILDMCSAPGGKATMIASIATSSQNMTLNEPNIDRLVKLREVLDLQGISDAEVLSENGSTLNSILKKTYDKILIDAECSTEAGINFLSRDPLAGWSESHIQKLSTLQKSLITSGYDLLNPGGVLIYATCTFAPEENESVVTYLLEQRPDAILQPLVFEPEKRIRHMHSWRGQQYPEQVAVGSLRIYPSDYMEGFFLARIRKPYKGNENATSLDQPLYLDQVIKRYIKS